MLSDADSHRPAPKAIDLRMIAARLGIVLLGASIALSLEAAVLAFVFMATTLMH